MFSIPLKPATKTEMFLRSQFFFYKIYFDLLDRSNSLIFTWNPEKECFEMNKSLVPKKVSYISICLNLIYLVSACYVFLMLRLKGTETSTISIAFHIMVLVGTFYCFLWRSLYFIKASELICIMNKIILFEKLHLQSKPIYLTKLMLPKHDVMLHLLSRNQLL